MCVIVLQVNTLLRVACPLMWQKLHGEMADEWTLLCDDILDPEALQVGRGRGDEGRSLQACAGWGRRGIPQRGRGHFGRMACEGIAELRRWLSQIKAAMAAGGSGPKPSPLAVATSPAATGPPQPVQIRQVQQVQQQAQLLQKQQQEGTANRRGRLSPPSSPTPAATAAAMASAAAGTWGHGGGREGPAAGGLLPPSSPRAMADGLKAGGGSTSPCSSMEVRAGPPLTPYDSLGHVWDPLLPT